MSLCLSLVKVAGATRSKRYSNDRKFDISLFNADMSMSQWIQDSYIHVKELQKELKYLDNQYTDR